ncbi:MAG: hypothetical protein LBL07_19940 [Tannerella sp.]|nr:hypothetical protein [Tannerella sp.]
MDNRFNRQKQPVMRVRELFSGSRLSGFAASSGTPFSSIVSNALSSLLSMRMCSCCCMHR